MNTRMYLGDGVYATFDGHNIKLQANGIDQEATDTIILEPGVLQALIDWREQHYPDYNTGQVWVHP